MGSLLLSNSTVDDIATLVFAIPYNVGKGGGGGGVEGISFPIFASEICKFDKSRLTSLFVKLEVSL